MATKSRPERWDAAVNNLNAALAELEGLNQEEDRVESKSAAEVQIDDARSALDEIRALLEEYEEWRDNLSDNLRDGPTGQKLDELLDGIDIDSVDFDGILDNWVKEGG